MPIDYGTNNVSSSGNINVSGIITATSGNFTTLRVNNTGVSISGHTHLSSDITNFNSSVSGLLSPYALLTNINTTQITGVLSTAKGGTGQSSYSNGQLLIGSGSTLVPNTLTAGSNISITNGSGTITISSTATGGGAVISNSGINRLLTNDGSTSGIVGQANLTFNGNLLNVTGSGIFTSGLNVSETTNVDKLRTNKSYSEKVSAVSISGGTLTINLNDANLFTCPLNASINTFNVSNVPSISGISISFSILLTANGSGYTVSWPSGTKWSNGISPILTTTNNKIDLFSFVSVDQGSSWLGFIGGQNF